MSKLLTASEKSDVRVAIKEIATKMTQKKLIDEDINSATKALAEKYKDDGMTAADFKKMAAFELAPEKAIEHDEKHQRLHELWEALQKNNTTSSNYVESNNSEIADLLED